MTALTNFYRMIDHYFEEVEEPEYGSQTVVGVIALNKPLPEKCVDNFVGDASVILADVFTDVYTANRITPWMQKDFLDHFTEPFHNRLDMNVQNSVKRFSTDPFVDVAITGVAPKLSMLTLTPPKKTSMDTLYAFKVIWHPFVPREQTVYLVSVSKLVTDELVGLVHQPDYYKTLTGHYGEEDSK